MNSIRRSASISNLGGGDKVSNAAAANGIENKTQSRPSQNLLKPQDMMIISPNLIKPSYQTSPQSPTGGGANYYHHQRNNSTNNLFPIQQNQHHLNNQHYHQQQHQQQQAHVITSQSQSRKTPLMNELKGRISSISDENLANPSKFKLNNVSFLNR